MVFIKRGFPTCDKAALERTRLAFQVTDFKCVVAFLQRCKLRSILGTGLSTAGVGANPAPGLDCLMREFLALRGGSPSSGTPGNGPFKSKEVPQSAASSRRLIGHFLICLMCKVFNMG